MESKFSRGPEEVFVGFHTEYERRLPVALYAPYALMLGANALMFFSGPRG